MREELAKLGKEEAPAGNEEPPRKKGPIPGAIKTRSALEADEDAMGFVAGDGTGVDIDRWRQQASPVDQMAYTRCLNTSWNFKQ
jgi:hypothetical protein